MNRLQKKCIIASAGVHLLLMLMLFLGPAFLSSRSKPDNTPVMTFVAISTTDENVSGGGDNTAKAPPALATAPEQPVAPPPVITPPAQVTPPVVERTVPPKVEKDPTPVVKDPPRDKIVKSDVQVKPQPPKHEIKVDTTIKIGSAADVKAIRDAQAKAAAAEKQRIAAAFGHATAGIRNGVSGSTEVKLQGPGTGGIPYGNFRSAVQKAYFDAWNVPDGAPVVTARVRVVIARDGTVVSSRIIDGSGNSAVDDSVQRALDRVKYAAPLPDGAKEEQRSVDINFNTEAKLIG